MYTGFRQDLEARHHDARHFFGRLETLSVAATLFIDAEKTNGCLILPSLMLANPFPQLRRPYHGCDYCKFGDCGCAHEQGSLYLLPGQCS
jgi:hypothetical protein